MISRTNLVAAAWLLLGCGWSVAASGAVAVFDIGIDDSDAFATYVVKDAPGAPPRGYQLRAGVPVGSIVSATSSTGASTDVVSLSFATILNDDIDADYLLQRQEAVSFTPSAAGALPRVTVDSVAYDSVSFETFVTIDDHDFTSTTAMQLRYSGTLASGLTFSSGPTSPGVTALATSDGFAFSFQGGRDIQAFDPQRSMFSSFVVTAITVPEPSTVALTAAGFAGAVGIIRRRLSRRPRPRQ
jgi:hypothetical protein